MAQTRTSDRLQEDLIEEKNYTARKYRELLRDLSRKGMPTNKLEIEYLDFVIELTNYKLTFYSMLEDVKMLKQRKRRVQKIRKQEGKKKLKNQDENKPMTFESICPWGSFEGILLEKVDKDWMVEIYETYCGQQIEDPNLNRLVEFITDHIDIICEGV